MSRLVLVRHGQARAFTADPDRLSDLGWKQGRALGAYWASQAVHFDAAFHGALRRQRETCEAVAQEYASRGAAFPQASEEPGLNEYAAQDIVAEIGPRLATSDREFAPLWAASQSTGDGPDQNRRFQIMFETLVTRWVSGAVSSPGLEPWEEFRSRVEDALRRVREGHPRGARIAAFTSGGPVGVAVQSCLKAPPEAALAVNWRVRNCSLTSFLFSGSRVSLDGFNELPHLADSPELVTFR